MKKIAAIAVGMTLSLGLGGCYKAEMEAAKVRADAAEAKVKQLETENAAAKVAVNQINTFRTTGAQLATVVNGSVDGVDTIKLVDINGVGPRFVKSGPRERKTWTLLYNSGILADQSFSMKRENGGKYVDGAIKGGRADGEWVWYDASSKPATRETYNSGKLVSVESVGGVDKDGKVSWKKLDKSGSDKFFKDHRAVFASVPELSREQ
jgi:hypothetical protein